LSPVVSFLALAQAEFDAAITYYESEQPGLGKLFRSEVSRSLHRILQRPDAYQQLSKGTRRCLIAKFPFGIIYRP
jgi:hypothetical protein